MTKEFRPTDEQVAARDKFVTGRSLKIRAFAGAGKTSTLSLLAKSRAEQGLYLAFNRTIAEEARHKFARNVECRTTHSIAYRHLAGAMNYPPAKLNARINPLQLADLAGMTGSIYQRGFRLNQVQRAFLVLKTITAFCQSADRMISPAHMPATGRLAALAPDIVADIRGDLVDVAGAVWRRMKDPADPLPLGHDGYLKVWALTRPKLPVDFILLDEAQDTNAVVLGVLTDQDAQLVFVGDPHQSIYEWRGAVDAMTTMHADETALLTQSFRFGPEIADLASRVLRTLGEKMPLRGNPDIRSSLSPAAYPHALLARTNSYLMAEAITAMDKGHSVHILGGVDELKRLIADVATLKAGRHASSPELFGFKDWDQVVEFSETDEGEDLKALVSLVAEHGETKILAALGRTRKEEFDADLIISTGHKAKGREFPAVRIAPDFDATASGREAADIPDAEARLFYVAITRAQRVLDVSPAIVRAYLERDRSVLDKSAAWPQNRPQNSPPLDPLPDDLPPELF